MQEQHLLRLVWAKEDQELQQIKKRCSQFGKYFFSPRTNTTLLLDKNMLFIIHKEHLKVVDLGRVYAITDLAYHPQRNVLAFLTAEGSLFVHFLQTKTQVNIKKNYKQAHIMEWIYGAPLTAHLIVAEEAGLHLYKLDEEKKTMREVKHLSGKYHCFLFEPMTENLLAFPYGDCSYVSGFHFEQNKAKNWFRIGDIPIKFHEDEVLAERIKRKKSLCLQGNRWGKEIFGRGSQSEEYELDMLCLCQTAYMTFYSPNEGKLQLLPIGEGDRRPVVIKLPSDCPPSLAVVDNMLVVHLRTERITFIYDILSSGGYQPLVSPYPLQHQDKAVQQAELYGGQFVGKRVVLKSGRVAKWVMEIGVIYTYLRANQMLIFDFLLRRRNAKMELIRWMRDNLFSFKQINLSKMWKAIFGKTESGQFDESETVTIVELYSNLFYTLSLEPLLSQVQLSNVLLQCLRQAMEYRVKIPEELMQLTAELLLKTQQYEMLVYLCHHNIVRPDPKIADMVYHHSQQKNQELLKTLAIDLAFQVHPPKQILRVIMRSERGREGKRFIRSHHEKMEVLDMLESAKYLKGWRERRQFVDWLRAFAAQKYPTMSSAYLDEAQAVLFPAP